MFERPTLVLVRESSDGSVLESRRMLVPVTGAVPSWWKGCSTGDGVEAILPTLGLAPGTWRARIEGTAGGDPIA